MKSNSRNVIYYLLLTAIVNHSMRQNRNYKRENKFVSFCCCWIHRLRCVIDYNEVRMRLENFVMYKTPSVYPHLFLKIWNFYNSDCYERLV